VEDFSDLGDTEFTFEAWIRTSDACHNSALFSYAAPPDDPSGGGGCLQNSHRSRSRSLTVAHGRSRSLTVIHQLTRHLTPSHPLILSSTLATSPGTEVEANHLVLANPNQLVLCHDFEYLDMLPDPRGESCYYAFNHTGPSVVSRDGTWRHVAATWTAANDGLVEIYVNGLLLSSARTRKTAPLKKHGIVAIGEEMDCFGACLDKGQGFNGEMDEVRLWRKARSQEEILKYMRSGEGLENHPDLAAYWKMDDPKGVSSSSLSVVKDSSGRGHDLKLSSPPTQSTQSITSRKFSEKLASAGVASFKNNFAMNQNFRGMPEKDITVEFWAKTAAVGIDQADTYSDFLSFASFTDTAGSRELVSIDEAILIQRYTKELHGIKDLGGKVGTDLGRRALVRSCARALVRCPDSLTRATLRYALVLQDIRTAGSISDSINSNRKGMGAGYENWIDYYVGWLDGDWHHVAVTWAAATGQVSLYFDGACQEESSDGPFSLAHSIARSLDRSLTRSLFRSQGKRRIPSGSARTATCVSRTDPARASTRSSPRARRGPRPGPSCWALVRPRSGATSVRSTAIGGSWRKSASGTGSSPRETSRPTCSEARWALRRRA